MVRTLPHTRHVVGVMSDRFDNDDTHALHPEWIVERRPCPLCEVRACGCPSEPHMVLVPANVVLGDM
jgi:hypothetical protein